MVVGSPAARVRRGTGWGEGGRAFPGGGGAGGGGGPAGGRPESGPKWGGGWAGGGGGRGGAPAAGEHEVGLSVAAVLAGRRRAGVGLHGAGRDKLPAVRRQAGPAARRAGARAGRARLGRSAVDLARVAALIARLFHVRYTPRG